MTNPGNIDRQRETALRKSLLDIPFVKLLGVELEVRGDELTMVMPYQYHLVGNPALPAIHGGVIGSFLETAATIELVFHANLIRLPKPVNINIDFHRSGRPMDTYARAKIVKRGRRISNMHVEAWQQDRGRPVAAAHGHFIMPQDEE
jgi:uncharacterized protein (TIGR00369 family)